MNREEILTAVALVKHGPTVQNAISNDEGKLSSPMGFDLNSELCGVFALDTGDHYRILTEKDLHESLVTFEELFARTLDNTAEIVESNIYIDQTLRFPVIKFGDLTASSLLISGLWNSLADSFKEGFRIAVPTRGVIWVLRDSDKRERLFDEMVQKTQAEESHPISRKKFRLQGSDWIVAE